MDMRACWRTHLSGGVLHPTSTLLDHTQPIVQHGLQANTTVGCPPALSSASAAPQAPTAAASCRGVQRPGPAGASKFAPRVI